MNHISLKCPKCNTYFHVPKEIHIIICPNCGTEIRTDKKKKLPKLFMIAILLILIVPTVLFSFFGQALAGIVLGFFSVCFVVIVWLVGKVDDDDFWQ